MICRRSWQFISAAVVGGVDVASAVAFGAGVGGGGAGVFGVAESDREFAAAREEVCSSLGRREEFLVRRMEGVEDVAVVL